MNYVPRYIRREKNIAKKAPKKNIDKNLETANKTLKKIKTRNPKILHTDQYLFLTKI